MANAIEDDARWSRIEQIFHEALALEPRDRGGFVQTACGQDESLRQLVESLLAHDNSLAALDATRKAIDRIGPYKLVGKLGAGGMGEVYLAQDTRLGRQVAVKILLQEFSSDAERRRRFLREAKAASALNHPNIVTVHDFGQEGETDYLVMEYIAGKPLDRLIPHNGLKGREAVHYGVQIADAVAHAHTAGILHRDLKPANVIVTGTGTVKVLDFGLAKVITSDITRSLDTRDGIILGTAAYMSPEQAEGKPVDARSDIFSFGSMLYEMVTGHAPFHRDSVASTIAAIVHDQPKPANTVADDIPLGLAELIDRCLRKSPVDRFQNMTELRLALEHVRHDSQTGVVTFATKPGKGPTRFKWVAGAFIAGTLVAAAVLWYMKPRPVESDLEAIPLTTYPGWESNASFSPDGTEVAFSWCKDRPEGPEFRPGYSNNCNIYIKQIGVEPPFRLTSRPAPEGTPTWSPDGKWIAFTRLLSPTKLGLFLIPPRGGRERALLELDLSRSSDPSYTPGNRQFAWTPDSKRLVSTSPSPGENWHLSLIDVDTGDQHRITNPPPTRMPIGIGDSSPAVSPLGHTLAFARTEARTDLYLLRLTDQYLPAAQPQRVRSDNSANFDPAWLPDGRGLVFASESNGEVGLWRISTSSGSRPQKLPFIKAAEPTLSARGHRLAYTEYRGDTNIWSIDLGSDGRWRPPTPIISSTLPDWEPACSPDGKRIAFVSSRSGTPELWACDRDGSNAVQLTSLGVEAGKHGQTIRGPQWSPDTQRIAFFFIGREEETLAVINANGGAVRRLAVPGGGKWPSWSRDGEWLYFSSADKSAIWKVRLTGGPPVQIAGEGRDLPQDSPDGKFIFYQKGWPMNVSVWKKPVQGGQETKLIEGVDPTGQWTVGPNGIYFFAVPDAKGHSDIRFYEFATGRVRNIETVERSIEYKIAVSSDGRSIFYTQVDEQGSNLMLVEGFR